MTLYYLLLDSTSPREAVDVFLRKEDAFEALAECLQDEPSWGELLSVTAVEIDETVISPN